MTSATITSATAATTAVATTAGATAASMAIRCERYLAPTRLASALASLANDGAAVTILAGGTDLMPQIQTRRKTVSHTLMNIRRIRELQSIEIDGDWLRIGALATITTIMRDPVVGRHFPVLVEACDHFASDQIRNAATLGGNISNASPAGDTLVPLIALDAEIELAYRATTDARVTAAAADGGHIGASAAVGAETATDDGAVIERRTIPIADYFIGPGRTRREAGELLTCVRIALPDSGQLARFFKFGTRPALDISAISIGFAAVRRGNCFENVRVAFGAVAPTPVRARATEQALEGKPLDASLIARVAATARDEVAPIDDVRASAWYRKEMIHNMTRRLLEDAAQA